MLSREELQRMKRTELQRLSKTYGIRANLKTEELVELLASESERALHPAPTPTIPVNSRSVSTRVGSRTRPRLQSNNTVVHHDDTDATDDGVLTPVPIPESEAAPSPATTTGPATRTRKAKNTQLRLGVGRPTAAGGPGPRAVTKSDSQSKLKRGKPSRVGRPTEEPIPEEQPQDVQAVIPPIAGPSQPRQLRAQTTEISIVTLPEDARAQIRQVVDEQVQPLLNTVALLRQELDESASTHRREVDALQKRVNDLTAEVEGYRRQAHSLEGLRTTVEQLSMDAPPARRSIEPYSEPMKFGMPSRGSQPPAPQPSRVEYRPAPIIEFPPPPSTKKASKEQGYYALGKRRRPLSDDMSPAPPVAGPSSIHPPIETHGGLVGPHQQKRARLDSPVDGGVTHSAFDTIPMQDPDLEPVGAPTPQPFTIYAGPEEPESAIMDEQFTDRDFEFFDAPPVPARGSGPVTSTAHASENQRLLPFGGLGGGIVPGATMTPDTHAPVPTAGQTDESPVVSHFPFPAAPHSPTPAPSSRIGGGPRAGSTQPMRMSMEPTPAPATQPATPPSTFTQPHTFGFGGNGMQYSAIAAALQQTPPSHRTLYGTEVGQDNRFGDFGFDWNRPLGR